MPLGALKTMDPGCRYVGSVHTVAPRMSEGLRELDESALFD